MDCLFCKIANKKERADIIYEDDKFIVFKDIAPKAPIHLLVVPKQHIVSVKKLQPENESLMGQLILTAKKVAEQKKLEGYKLAINVGREGGQLIDHLHVHLLSGKPNLKI